MQMIPTMLCPPLGPGEGVSCVGVGKNSRTRGKAILACSLPEGLGPLRLAGVLLLLEGSVTFRSEVDEF